MKKLLLYLLLTLGMAPAGLTAALQEVSSASTLSSVEVFHNGDISTEARFVFSKPFRFKKFLVEQESRLRLHFPDSSMGAINTQRIISSLSATGMVENVTFGRAADGGIHLNLKFRNDKVLVKLIKGKDSNKLILEIFSKEALAKIRKAHDGPLLLTHNDLALQSEAKKKSPNAPFTVLLDAGHGGVSVGAIGVNGIREKDVTLDIAKKVRTQLKVAGIRVVMSRTDDRDIGLGERSRLACDVGADLFVSVHANAAPSSSTAYGIETYVPSVEPAFGSGSLPGNSPGLLLARNSSDTQLASVAQQFVLTRQELSRSLAKDVQTNLLSLTAANSMETRDRGVKEASFLVLARGVVPSVLIEVGFVTHRQEATRLATPTYRNLLASGISRAIVSYKEGLA